MALFCRKVEMIIVAFLWMLVSGPLATCSAFLMLDGKAVVTFRSEHSLSSVQAQKPTVESTRIFLASGTENDTLPPVSSRRNMITTSVMFVTGASQIATKANADVSDGNALPEGAQQFARVIKLKIDLKDVTKRLLTASDENPIEKKEWDNISKFLRTVYSIADNDMKSIARGLSYNPPNQKQASTDVDEIKKYSQAGDVSASKQDATRLASILTKISELLDDFLSSLSDIPDEI